jgi:hypothetical protein
MKYIRNCQSEIKATSGILPTSVDLRRYGEPVESFPCDVWPPARLARFVVWFRCKFDFSGNDFLQKPTQE